MNRSYKISYYILDMTLKDLFETILTVIGAILATLVYIIGAALPIVVAILILLWILG